MTNLASDTAATLDVIVARFNIEHFLKRLTEETDQSKLQTLRHLVEEEKARLSALLGGASSSK
jgi:hypothetical protein